MDTGYIVQPSDDERNGNIFMSQGTIRYGQYLWGGIGKGVTGIVKNLMRQIGRGETENSARNRIEIEN